MDGELQESLAMRAADTARRFRWERVVATTGRLMSRHGRQQAATSPLTGHERGLTGTRPGGRQPAAGI